MGFWEISLDHGVPNMTKKPKKTFMWHTKGPLEVVWSQHVKNGLHRSPLSFSFLAWGSWGAMPSCWSMSVAATLLKEINCNGCGSKSHCSPSLPFGLDHSSWSIVVNQLRNCAWLSTIDILVEDKRSCHQWRCQGSDTNWHKRSKLTSIFWLQYLLVWTDYLS